MTTIKVSAATHGRVRVLTARTQETADEVVGHALDEYERALFWREYDSAAAAVAADPDVAEQENAERRLWDRTLRDGLDRA